MRLFLLIILLLINFTLFAQIEDRIEQLNFKKHWYISSAFGIQISGIKDEDFISKNVAPALTFSSGFWFTPPIGLQFSYKGPYFFTIADDDRHPYLFIYTELLLNINEIVNFKKHNKSKWRVFLHFGPGYFHNYYFNQAKLNGNLGVINNFKLTELLEIFLDVSFIVGWDIYQGNEDILPSGVLGISYSFK